MAIVILCGLDDVDAVEHGGRADDVFTIWAAEHGAGDRGTLDRCESFTGCSSSAPPCSSAASGSSSRARGQHKLRLPSSTGTRDHSGRERQADHGRNRRTRRDRRLRLGRHDRGRDRHTRETPSTDAEWAAVGASAAALVESGNLLVIGDRAVDRGDWVKMSKALADAGMLVLKAADAKDADGHPRGGRNAQRVVRQLPSAVSARMRRNVSTAELRHCEVGHDGGHYIAACCSCHSRAWRCW